MENKKPLYVFLNFCLLKLGFKTWSMHRPYHIFENHLHAVVYYDNDLKKRFKHKTKGKKLKILTYPWHISHQYELYKLGHEFTLITDAGSWQTVGWNLDYRPIPPNVEFKSIREVDIKDYDLAVLHFDENVLTPQNCCQQVKLDWGKTFKFFREKIDLPKVAICHGTPQFYGQYNLHYQGAKILETIESERLKFVNYLDDIIVITNSYQAQSEWKFNKSKVIWHGFDPNEFPLGTYKKGILSLADQAMISRTHYRGYHIYQEVTKKLPKENQPSSLNIITPQSYNSPNHYALLKFLNYVNNIREFSIYFNPTIRSPMPRSRGEAMMCGLATVSLKNHDVDRFIKNGFNGFYAETPQELAEILTYLLAHPDATYIIGQNGRDRAMDLFHIDHYLEKWEQTIAETLTNKLNV